MATPQGQPMASHVARTPVGTCCRSEVLRGAVEHLLDVDRRDTPPLRIGVGPQGGRRRVMP
eukprot:6841492-Heterocapsa_arctica.AAC.1